MNYTNFNLIGIGEQGKPEHLTAAESEQYEKLFKVNGFNAALSDKIALDRAVPDIRHKGYVTPFHSHCLTASVSDVNRRNISKDWAP